jgi:general stress protein YciG
VADQNQNKNYQNENNQNQTQRNNDMNQNESQGQNQNQNKNPGQENESTGMEKRGFASMDPDKQRDIASKGGQSVAPENRSFSQDRNLASEAGRKGGESSTGSTYQSQQSR